MTLTPRLISIDQFAEMASVGRTKAWQMLKLPGAPEPVLLGTKTTRYRYEEAVAFLDSLPTAKRLQPAELVGRRFRDGKPVQGAA